MNHLDELRFDKRHLWLLDAAEMVKRWREEDRAAGIIWEGDEDERQQRRMK